MSCLILVWNSGKNIGAEYAVDFYMYNVTITVYANVNGHAGKYCEQTLEFSSRERGLSICMYDNRVCLRDEMLIAGGDGTMIITQSKMVPL